MTTTKKLVIAVVALSVMLCCAIGGTLAYLWDKTTTVTNTFTYGDINIDLTETEREYKMIPGKEFAKDPTVIVEADSEACWLFIKVVKTNNPDTYLDYSIDTSIWTALPGVEGVYYCEVSAVSEDTPYAILTGNKVIVKAGLTKQQLTAIGTNYPTLSFTAYAVQADGFNTPAAAWDVIPNSNN